MNISPCGGEVFTSQMSISWTNIYWAITTTAQTNEQYKNVFNIETSEYIWLSYLMGIYDKNSIFILVIIETTLPNNFTCNYNYCKIQREWSIFPIAYKVKQNSVMSHHPPHSSHTSLYTQYYKHGFLEFTGTALLSQLCCLTNRDVSSIFITTILAIIRINYCKDCYRKYTCNVYRVPYACFNWYDIAQQDHDICVRVMDGNPYTNIVVLFTCYGRQLAACINPDIV